MRPSIIAVETKPQIFISYSQRDKVQVQALESALNELGLRCWRDASNLRAGERWPLRLGEAVSGCNHFVLMWSVHAATSDFVELEWNIAVALKRRPIIIRFDARR